MMFRTLTFLILLCVPCLAANKYVRQGASGTASGDDWTNAYPTLPATLTRDTIYYIGDGSYVGYTFDDAESGTLVITLKKATVADHGTSTGWDNTYGDGRAAFTGSLNMARDYITVDGSTRNESNWQDVDSYGIRTTQIYGQNGNDPPGGDKITVKYCDIGGAYSTTYYSGMEEAVYVSGQSGKTFDTWTIQYCALHNSTGAIVQFDKMDTAVVEYCWIGLGWGKEAIRGQNICSNVTVRHNTFFDSTQTDPDDGSSGLTAEIGMWDYATVQSGIKIYGNTFMNSKSGGRNSCIVVGGNGGGWTGSASNGTLVYNNTFAGVDEASVEAMILLHGTGTEAKNNEFYDCASTTISASSTATNLVSSSDPFVNYAGNDLRIIATTGGTYPRNAGTDLGASYNTDRLGNTRGSDGTWDVGAYEYASGGGGGSGAINATTITGGIRIGP